MQPAGAIRCPSTVPFHRPDPPSLAPFIPRVWHRPPALFPREDHLPILRLSRGCYGGAPLALLGAGPSQLRMVARADRRGGAGERRSPRSGWGKRCGMNVRWLREGPGTDPRGSGCLVSAPPCGPPPFLPPRSPRLPARAPSPEHGTQPGVSAARALGSRRRVSAGRPCPPLWPWPCSSRLPPGGS